MVDLKAGFHKVPLDYETSLMTTFVTHMGKFRWLRMPFGLQNAPNHFQWVMESILHEEGTEKLPTNIYLDDVGLKGDDLDILLD
mgnify:FL=1